MVKLPETLNIKHYISLLVLQVFKASMMKKLLGLILGFTGQVDSKLSEDILIDFRKHNAGMNLAAAKLGQNIESLGCLGIRNRTDGKSDEKLVRMESGIMITENSCLKLLIRLDYGVGNEFHFIRNACQMFYAVKEQCRGRAQEGAGLSRDHGSVLKLRSSGGSTCESLPR